MACSRGVREWLLLFPFPFPSRTYSLKTFPFLFSLPAIGLTIFRILESRETCISYAFKTKITKLTSYARSINCKPSFLVTVNYLSLFIVSYSKLSVNYVRCSSVSACCYAIQDLFLDNMCYFHSRGVPIIIPFLYSLFSHWRTHLRQDVRCIASSVHNHFSPTTVNFRLTVGFLRTLTSSSINPFHQRQLVTNLRLNLS